MFWNKILQTAQLGTGRAPELGDAGMPAALAETLNAAKAGTADAEERFLRTAALAGQYILAARPAIKVEAGADLAAVPETLPRCSAEAAGLLKDILDKKDNDLLDYWLASCDAAGQRVREDLLPDLLTVVSSARQRWLPVIRVAGERGRWLARYNPFWKYAALTPETMWEEGRVDERMLAWKAIRAQDPTGALDLLKAAWKEFNPEKRTEFLRMLEPAQYVHDREFLEFLKGDKNAKLKLAVRQYLSVVPGTAELAALKEYTRDWIRLEQKKGILGIGAKQILHLQLPESLPAELEEAGIVAKPPSNDWEAPQWWLGQVIDRLPLDAWPRQMGLSVEEFYRLVAKDDKLRFFFPLALRKATAVKDAEAIKTLMVIIGGEEKLLKGLSPDSLAGALAVLPPKAGLEIFTLGLHDRAGSKLSLLDSLQALAGPWTKEFSREMMKELEKDFRRNSHPYYQNPLEALWDKMHPSILEQKENLLKNTETLSYWNVGLNSLLRRMEMKAGIDREFVTRDS